MFEAFAELMNFAAEGSASAAGDEERQRKQQGRVQREPGVGEPARFARAQREAEALLTESGGSDRALKSYADMKRLEHQRRGGIELSDPMESAQVGTLAERLGRELSDDNWTDDYRIVGSDELEQIVERDAVVRKAQAILAAAGKSIKAKPKAAPAKKPAAKRPKFDRTTADRRAVARLRRNGVGVTSYEALQKLPVRQVRIPKIVADAMTPESGLPGLLAPRLRFDRCDMRAIR